MEYISLNVSTIIFDIGDVLFTWSPETPTSLSPRTIRDIISSPTWGRYECGKLAQEECYQLIASEHGLDSDEVKCAFQHARDSLKPNSDFYAFIRTLKDQHPGLRIFAMSNISGPDYEVLRTKDADWSMFDDIFLSYAAGMRKPNLGFYQHVLRETGSDPRFTAFVDDKAENVLAARSVGLHGIVFDRVETVRQALLQLIGDPVQRATKYLQDHAGRMESVTDTGLVIGDNFSQLLIYELTHQRRLVKLIDYSATGKWNFFRDRPALTTAEFPYDMDTTSIGLTVLEYDPTIANYVMDEMLSYLDEDGIVQTYFDFKRARRDPVVCVNVLCLFHAYDRGEELLRTQSWVLDVLRHRAYLDGTRYYETPECFLFFFSRLLPRIVSYEGGKALRVLLRERLLERVGAPGDALALAMRIIACARVGIKDELDLRQLLPMQLEDGSWGPGSIYKYGSSGVRIGNFGLATALALNAVEEIAGLSTDEGQTELKFEFSSRL
ncbi:HAD-like domain-containing protein [Vararia minispora EC-137]|uniref:HAD-like domain-containing protein n=1 Tax=Vararia minispora EC-137 TaxID=1314806 RepID=A0ACB8QDH9_9AGAM|nr:HAD-like domain-containing protein [Vararia minispora EC-137]